MSYSYDRYERQQRRQTFGASGRRSTFGYWVPLVMTITVATVGLAAWIWSERRDDDEDDYDGKGYAPPPPGYGGVGPGHTAYAPGAEPPPPAEDASMMARMSGALRRTPSPQQLLDGASRRVAAGVAAAGAVVGGALSSIREEDNGHFEDHSRWSEEAIARAQGTQSGPTLQDNEVSSAFGGLNRQQQPTRQQGSDKRKTVAVVISSETTHHGYSEEDITYHQEHASILSHLPDHVDAESRIFVLIYSPGLSQHPLASNSQPGGSIASSYSNIGHEDAQIPGEESHKPLTPIDPRPASSPPENNMFQALYSQAQTLVDKETMIMPFTSPSGYVHLLRHIAPEVVYIQETLSGPGGDAVTHISGWVGQVVLVVGDESGHGGLVDSEDEQGASGEEGEKWWQHDPRIGLGKGIEVVDGLRVGEDWRRRVRGHD